MVETVNFAAALTAHETHDVLCQQIFLLAKGRSLQKVGDIRDFMLYTAESPEMSDALSEHTKVLIQIGDPAFVRELTASLRLRLRLLEQSCA